VRTGIAVIAFGFVIEKFNLFVLTMANANSLDAGRRLQLERRSGSLGRYDGLALILLGIAIVVATLFVPGSCSMTRKHIPWRRPRRVALVGGVR
jgi:putative membrane protein